MKAVFVKLGGSLITDKAIPNHAEEAVINGLAEEISELQQQDPDLVWFIGNGAGSFGHYAVHQTKWKEAPDDPLRVATIREATGKLNSLLLASLLAHQIPALSFPPAAFIYKDNDFQCDPKSVFKFASLGATPLVYGDMIHDDEKGSRIISTEETLSLLAREWLKHGNAVHAFIYCTSVDGVLDNNNVALPSLKKGATITSITKTKGYDVTGGMAQKIAAGFENLELTPHVFIINGTKSGNLTKAIELKAVGTRLEL